MLAADFRVVSVSNEDAPPEPVLRQPAGQCACCSAGACGHVHADDRGWQGRLLTVLMLSGLLAGWISGLAALYAVSFAAGAASLARGLWPELRSGRLGVSTLMLMAALGAAALGHWGEGALLLCLFWGAGKLEERSLERTRRTVREMLALRPVTARVAGKEVPIQSLEPGCLVEVWAGETIPVDGVVTRGESSVDQASLTGESVPLHRKCGDRVLAGSVNCEAPLTVEVTERPGEFMLDRFVALVTEAQGQKTPAQSFMQRYGGVYAWTILLAAAAWVLFSRWALALDWSQAFYRGLVLLVVASPCALVLAQPAALLSGLARGARRGILIKGGEHFSRIARARALALDKTGTLTTGDFRVLGGVAPESPEQWLARAARLAGQSQHPLSRAIWKEAQQRGLTRNEELVNHTAWGRGIEGILDGEIWRLGRLDYVGELADISGSLEEKARACAESGESIVFLGSRHAVGFLRLADQIRPEAAPALRLLRELGVEHHVVLSGDHRSVVGRVAFALDVPEFHGELLPEEKAAHLGRLSPGCLMVGDGVNDSPALARACVGISLGPRAAGAAVETADVVLMTPDLHALGFLKRLSRAVTRVTTMNLVFATLVMVGLTAGVTTGQVSLAHGVLAHEGSSLLVVLNGMRLLAFR